MKEITKEEFYGIIREKKLNVYVSVIEEHKPFTTLFKFPNGTEFGRCVEIGEKYPYEEKYYFPQFELPRKSR